jgi:hypothetical protein
MKNRQLENGNRSTNLGEPTKRKEKHGAKIARWKAAFKTQFAPSRIELGNAQQW